MEVDKDASAEKDKDGDPKAENVSRRTVNEQLVIKRQLKSGVRQAETPMK